MPMDEPLTSANLVPSKQKEYSVSINTKSKRKKKQVVRSIQSDDIDNEITASSANELESLKLDMDICARKKEFVGLKNVTMTCYLNSMIQGLWFTPEFRNLIYSYNGDQDTRKSDRKSICKPLQKLFLQLQFSSRDSIETDELTRTFGWTDRDTWNQHDIQELCTLLMENLSSEFKSTPQDGIINSMYYGVVTDYVKCLECNNKSSRPDEFLVLPVAIQKPNRDALDAPTLESAIKQFITPEILDGNNQYQCGKCNKQVDAHKGIMFKKLPWILTIQLKRFGNDWETNRRYKLNDRLIFPVALDMNEFIDKSEKGESGQGVTEEIPFDLIKSGSEGPQARLAHSRPIVSLIDEDVDEPIEETSQPTEVVDIGSKKDVVLQNLRKMKETNGPEVYQLFAVFVHRGGLAGGHYFAYIRDFETYRWYRCDDSSVRKAEFKDITGTFGDPNDKEQTSAYMLMYRRFDDCKSNNLPFLQSELPGHLTQILGHLNEEDTRAHDDEIIEKNTMRMVVKHRAHLSSDLKSMDVFIPKSLNTKQVALFVFNQFFVDLPDPSLEQIRVCRFDQDLGLIENSFEDETQYLTYSLKHPVPVTKNEALILEVKQEGEEFTPYKSDDLIFIAKQTDFSSERITGWVEFHLAEQSTVGDLRKMISKKWGLSLENLKLAVVQPQDAIQLLSVDGTGFAQYRSANERILEVYFENLKQESDLDTWLDFVSNLLHYDDYEISIQQLPESYSDANSFNELSRLNVRVSVSEVEKGISVPILPNGNVNNIDQAMNNSESLHDGISKDVKNPEIKESPSEEHCIEMTKLKEAIDSTTAKHSVITFVTRGNEDSAGIRLAINLDRRLKIGTLSKALGDIMKIEEKHFSFFFSKEGDDVEILNYQTSLKDLVPSHATLKVRFCPRLKSGEGRVGVFYLNFKDLESSGAYLGDVALNPKMTEEEVKSAILEQCYYGQEQTPDIKKCRLRKKLASNRPSKIFRDGTVVGEWLTRVHDAEMYFEILNDVPFRLGRDHFAVTIRKWIPSTWTLELPTEFIVMHDHSREVPEIISEKVLEITGIPLEDLEIARVECPFPYKLNPLGVEELEWFSLSSEGKKPLYLYNDELVLFVRNKSDSLKKWTLDEEREFRKENDVDAITPASRKEYGLKMHLGISSTED